MATSRRFGSLAFDIQPLGGPHSSTPLFRVPIISGGMGPMKEWDDLPRIGSNLSRLGRFPKTARGGGTVRILAHPESLGLLLYMVCGAQASAGVGPTTHTFTVTDEYPPDLSMTVWTNVGMDGLLGSTYRFDDAFIDKMTIEGVTGNNIEISLDLSSFNYAPETNLTLATTTEDEEPRLKYIGSVVLLSPDQNIPTDEYSAERVSFEIDRAAEYRYGPSLTPQLIVPDRLVNFSASWTFDSTVGAWDFLNEEYTGSITGQALTGGQAAQNTPQGSFDVKFGRHPNDVTRYLEVASNGRNWEYDIARPDAEAQPGTLELEANGIVTTPDALKGGVGESEVTITLINDFAGDYS